MNNSYLAKGLSLAAHLIRRPQLIPSYLRHLPCWGGQPMMRELPWISFGALHYLEAHLQPHHEVFEFGGGGSTLYFARRTRSVVTIESHAEWHERLVSMLNQRRLRNVRCELHPLTGDAIEQFQNDSFFQSIRKRMWDVILVDCYCGFSASPFGQLRPHALTLAMEQLNPGGFIVLDDSWMYQSLLTPRLGWRIIDYIGPGPCRYGVTSTAILEKLPPAK